jgi:hypothetical protein
MNIIFKITILKEIYIFDNLRIKMMKNFYSSFKFLILLDANQKLNPQIKQTHVRRMNIKALSIFL